MYCCTDAECFQVWPYTLAEVLDACISHLAVAYIIGVGWYLGIGVRVGVDWPWLLIWHPHSPANYNL